MIAYIFQRMGLLYNQEVATIQNNSWLQTHWKELLSAKEIKDQILFKTLFSGANSGYPPFWMMKYMIMGTIISIILYDSLRSVNVVGKILVSLFFFYLFYNFLDHYYLCFGMGVFTEILREYLQEKYKKSGVTVKFILGIIIEWGGGPLEIYPLTQ